MMRTCRLLLSAAISLGLSCWSAGSLAQAPYPSKPIRIVVPYTPGGGVDLLARIVGGMLTEAWGQPAIIDHRPGGSATLGPAYAAKSPPDGYTLVLVTTGFTMTPGLQKVPYDPVRDFTPLTLIAVVPNVLVVHPSLPAKSLKELVTLSASQEMTYASSGYGSVGQLVMEMLRITVPRLQLAHVPYKGNSQALTGVLTGEVAIAPTALPSAMPHISTGRLRPIAITTAKRSASVPQVPTLAESGAQGFEYASDFGLLLPARTPADIVAKLYGEIARALKTPDVIQKLSSQGYEIVALGPDEYAASIRTNLAKWAKVIESAKIRAQ
jgi:tripartite-type tricarboxylate transporter receptor subunit TctC